MVHHDVWQGIDVEWYESKGHLEFDFVVHPGADPKQIKMVCEGLTEDLSYVGCVRERTATGADAPAGRMPYAPTEKIPEDCFVSSGAQGRALRSSQRQIKTLDGVGINSDILSLMTSLGELRMSIPGAYQTTSNGTRRNEVTAQFSLVSGNVFAIDLPNGYDNSHTLRIDPLVYSTYLGGGADDGCASGMSVDVDGGVVIGGSTRSSNFPTTAGSFDSTFNSGANGFYDCFVTKMNSSLSQLVFSTFIGGENDDYGESITKADSNGYLFAG